MKIKNKLKIVQQKRKIQDFQTFNPLYDFKLIRGRFYAIQSIPVRKMIEVVNKKTGETEIKWITTWKTYYSDESGCILMAHSGVRPVLSVVFDATIRGEFSVIFSPDLIRSSM